MKLNFALIISLILIVFSSIGLSNAGKFYKSNVDKVLSYETYKEEVSYVYTPSLKENTVFPDFSAQAILAVDLASDKILYEKNPDLQLLPASTTKIITALVAMDKYPLDLIVTVGNVNVEGQKMHLVEGEKITVRNLLYGLLVESGNDAAEVLAQSYPGGKEAFVLAMNEKAQEIGLRSTYFTNPSGFDGDHHQTTARDLIKASIFAMQRPFFSKVVSTKEIQVTSIDNAVVHKLENLNELLGEIEGVAGVKTGWTEKARENLVTYVQRGDKKVIIAVLGSQDRFNDTRNLIDWIFDNYEWKMVKEVAADNYSSLGR